MSYGPPVTTMPAIIPQSTQNGTSGSDAYWVGSAPSTSWIIGAINYSYSATPAAGTLLVLAWSAGSSSAGSESYYVSAAEGQIVFYPKQLPVGSSCTITAKGSASVTCNVYPEACVSL